MVKLYDVVRIKKSGLPASVVEIYDANGTKAPQYCVEILDEYKHCVQEEQEVVFWCDYSEVEEME